MIRGSDAGMRAPRPAPLARAGSRLAAAALLAALASCARVAPPPAAPPAPPRPAPGYDRLRDSLDALDPAVFAGKRVALDPGHGGWFAGALGVHGLTEASVNLGVALELRRLLETAGATVLLTREADRDFLSPADSTLRSDLATRVRLVNEFRPDVLVSIHHNADPAGRHDVNETVTYYKLGDDGPSLDLAESVHRALVRNVAISPQRIVPGNFAVVRGSDAPAILTETSYITNPDVEERLRLPEKQRLEAEALWLGLGHYFARRVPVVEEFVAWTPDAPPGRPVSGAAMPSLRARIRGPFDAAELALDGVPVEPLRSEARLDWTPPAPLERGVHEATLRVRLAGQGSSPLARLSFEIEDGPGRLVAEFPGQAAWERGEPLALRVRVLDHSGLPWRDTLSLRVRGDGTRLLAPSDTVVVARDGAAWAYFRRSRHALARGATSVSVRAALLAAAPGAPAAPRPGEARARIAVSSAERPAARAGFALVMPDGVPLAGAPGTREPAPLVRWINRDGFVRLADDSLGRAPLAAGGSAAPAVPELPGYRPWIADSPWPPRFAAVTGGALRGRRIVLDPDGGGEASGGSGAGGTRGSSFALAVARALAGFLEAAGAEVKLTRAGDFSVSDVERVQVSEAFRADRFLRVGFRSEPPQLGHYFGSAAGKRWAERTRAELARLGLPAPGAAENAQYPIAQTSCVSLYAGLARLDDSTSEARLLSPGTLRAAAYALYLGLAREWAPDADWPLDSLEVRDEAGHPVAGAPVTLGGALVLETDALGRARFARTEPGPLEAAVEDPRVRARGVLLDSSRAFVLTGPPIR